MLNKIEIKIKKSTNLAKLFLEITIKKANI